MIRILSLNTHNSQDPSPHIFIDYTPNSATPINHILWTLMIILLSLVSLFVYSGSIYNTQGYTRTNKRPPCNEESLIPAAYSTSPCTHSSIMSVFPPDEGLCSRFSSVYAALIGFRETSGLLPLVCVSLKPEETKTALHFHVKLNWKSRLLALSFSLRENP